MIDFPFNLRDSKADDAWRTASVWLSLDRFERFWPDVGLTLSNGAAAKSAVRHVLCIRYAIDTEWRANYYDDPDAPEDLEAPDPKKDLPQLCFRRINETAGAQDAECIARWLKGPVLGAEMEWTYHPWYMWHHVWNDLLYQLGEKDPNLFAYRYGISPSIARRIVEIAARFRSEVEVNRERVEAADQEPLLGWDAIAAQPHIFTSLAKVPEPSPSMSTRPAQVRAPSAMDLHIARRCPRTFPIHVNTTRPGSRSFDRACSHRRDDLLGPSSTIRTSLRDIRPPARSMFTSSSAPNSSVRTRHFALTR